MSEEKNIKLDEIAIEELENEIDLKAYFERRDEEKVSLETVLAKTKGVHRPLTSQLQREQK